ncbi:hypothetical protein [Tahibacter caeni]|uniref:hypothetical protein n=1 Tax=Tahibacter caeni TaxID=1453545 RepID=UPI002148D460|nr:hypothetical protein [Tahibacter caeni]
MPINDIDANWIAPVVGFAGVLIAQIVAMTISYHTRKRAQWISLITKTVDVSMHCTKRYEELSKEYSDILKRKRELKDTSDPKIRDQEREEIEDKSRSYWASFWALKSDQFDFWLLGVLDHDTFFDWSYSLSVKISKELIKENKNGHSITNDGPLLRSWNDWVSGQEGPSHSGSNPQFVSFIKSIVIKTKLVRVNAKIKGNDIDRELAIAILDLMGKLEGTKRKPGFSRRYRKLAWSGNEFLEFAKMLRKDIDIRNLSNVVGDIKSI